MAIARFATKETTAMKQPKAAGTTVQALEPLVQKLAGLEGEVLGGTTMSVAELSTALAKIAREIACCAMETLLEQAACVLPTQTTCTCGAQAGSRGFEITSFVGRFGRVRLRRRRMECPACGRSWFEFDQVWGIPAGDYADDVREAAERQGCRLGSFVEAAEELRHMWGVEVAPTTIQRWVGEDGERAMAAVHADAEESWKRYEERAHAEACGEAAPVAREEGFGVIEVDGVHALTWKPGCEPRRKKPAVEAQEPPAVVPDGSAGTATETDGRLAAHQPPSTLSEVPGSPMGPSGRSPRVRGREVSVGLTYLGEDACEESPGRGVLLDKRYVATLNDREGFWLELHAAATAQGALSKEKLLRLSDGGTYYVEQSAEVFRDQPLVGILDIQHANQHVWETGHKLVPDSKKTKAWVTPHLNAIYDGKVDDVIADLTKELLRYTGAEQRKSLEGLIGYLSRHRHLMNYPEYRKAGYPIASAAIESTNKRLVSRRCKQGGMIWGERGLEAMVAIRVAFYNPGAWERLWPHTAVKTAA
jgi:hypothetical protein